MRVVQNPASLPNGTIASPISSPTAVGDATVCTAPIFIVGSVHSGTTLLRKVLDRHPAIFSGRGETSFFHSLSLIQRKFPDLATPEQRRAFAKYLVDIILTGYNKVNFSDDAESTTPKWELSAEQVTTVTANMPASASHAQIFRQVYENLTALAGKSRWVEKTPGHLYYIHEILRVFPDARFIEIVRDPRDILASKRSRREEEWLASARDAKGAYADLQGGYDPLLDTLGWKSAIQAGDKARRQHPTSVLRVRYEDFVADPSSELTRICDFLTLAAGPAAIAEMLDVGWSNTTTASKKGAHGIGTASIGKWQRQLPPAAIALCQIIVRHEMQQLRYTVVKTNVRAYVGLPMVVTSSTVSMLDRLQRRWRLGGSKALRNQFGNYRSRLRTFSSRS